MRHRLSLLLAIALIAGTCGEGPESGSALADDSTTLTATTDVFQPSTTSAATSSQGTATTTTRPLPATTTTRPPSRFAAARSLAIFYGGLGTGNLTDAFAQLDANPGFEVTLLEVASAAGWYDEISSDIGQSSNVFAQELTGGVRTDHLRCEPRTDGVEAAAFLPMPELGEHEYAFECVEFGADGFWSPVGLRAAHVVTWVFGGDGLRLAGGDPFWSGWPDGVHGSDAAVFVEGFADWAGQSLPAGWTGLVGEAAGSPFPFTAAAAPAVLELMVRYVEEGQPGVRFSIVEPSTAVLTLMAAYAALGEGDVVRFKELVGGSSASWIGSDIPGLVEHLNMEVEAACHDVVSVISTNARVVVCDITIRDDFYGPAGITPTGTVRWFVRDGTRFSVDGGTHPWLSPSGTMLGYMDSFGLWLSGAHPSDYRASNYQRQPCGCFPFPDLEKASLILPYVSEFLAQSDEYPLQD